MLDRGEQKDWFQSTEVIAELTLACLGLYLFLVHMFTAEKPFIPPRIFKDRNFSASFFIMFAIGMILLSSSALLPPYLQNLGGYSITQTGLLMAPRGAGTKHARLLAGWCSSPIDPRLLMLAGIAMLCYSMWEMTAWTPDLNAGALAWTTFVQGLGLGFVFIPLQLVAFATLPADLRGDGTALFSLIRNVGSAVGISIATFLLAQGTQTMHARIAESVSPFNRMLQSGGAHLFWNSGTIPGLAALNAEVTRQASIIAYANDFKFMLMISLPTAFLLLFLKRPQATSASPEHAVLD